MGQKVALVAGASGVVGTRIAETLAQLQGWRVLGCSRHLPAIADRIANVDYVAIDLTDFNACRSAIRDVEGITHLFYTARHQFVTGQQESTEANTAMFRNILAAIEEAKHPLEHVHLVHGTKYYGSTLGPYPTPSREDDPRCLQSNFYYDQEDLVVACTDSRAWSWSASRPHAICDFSLTTPRSLPMLIATYATIAQHLGQPLSFPGTPGNFRAVYQCTDAGLLARAIVWMSTNAACADQAFNVTNGDFFRWQNFWPMFARYFRMPEGPLRTIRLAELMADKAPLWNDITRRHGLAAMPYERMALWSYGDFIFGSDWDIMSSVTKLRRYGFHETLDTEEMFIRYFDSFRARKVIPPVTG